MNYEEKQYEEIFEEVLNESLEKGLISHAEEFPNYIANAQDISNYYVMDKSVISSIVSKVYKSMTALYESAKVEFAEGIDLDHIGEIVGIERPQATYPEVECEFILVETLDEDLSIDEGVIVSTDSGIQYETVEPIFIATGNTTATVQTRAVTQGVKSKIIENSLNNIISNVGVNLIVNNPSSSTGGSETYSDDEYRYLIMNHKKINLKGSFEAYDYYFASLDGIDGYRVIENWDGSGTVKCILDPGTPYQLNKAYNEIQESVAQISQDLTMFSPTPKPIDIYAVVDVDIDMVNPYSTVEKSDIQARIVSAIKIFIDGGYVTRDDEKLYYPGLLLGEDFIPHKLAVFLDVEVPELKSIRFNYPENPVTILDEEIGVSNEIIIEMV